MFHILKALPQNYEYLSNSFSEEMANIYCARLIAKEEQPNVDYVVVDSQILDEYNSYNLVSGIPNQVMVDIEKEMVLVK